MSSNTIQLRLVVHDWAGTIIDYGSLAPVEAFVAVFAGRGVPVSAEEARAPMGLHKKDHLVAMLRSPAISGRWRETIGSDWNEADVASMYNQLIPAQLATVQRYSKLIPGWVEVASELRRQELKLAGTTGYFPEATRLCLEAAREQGYEPDANASGDDVPAGRPAPWMIFRVMQQTGVYPSACVLKVGDTRADIEEGLNAGVWSVGVCAGSNEMGLDEAAFLALSDDDRRARLDAIGQRFHSWGADAAIDSIADLPELVEEINRLLAQGQRPQGS